MAGHGMCLHVLAWHAFWSKLNYSPNGGKPYQLSQTFRYSIYGDGCVPSPLPFPLPFRPPLPPFLLPRSVVYLWASHLNLQYSMYRYVPQYAVLH